MTSRWMTIFFSVLLAGASVQVHAAGRADVVRDLAGRVGPIIGSGSACPDIARPRIDSIVAKFTTVIRESASNDAERGDFTRLLDRTVADGRVAATAGRIDCRTAGRQLGDLEQTVRGTG